MPTRKPCVVQRRRHKPNEALKHYIDRYYAVELRDEKAARHNFGALPELGG